MSSILDNVIKDNKRKKKILEQTIYQKVFENCVKVIQANAKIGKTELLFRVPAYYNTILINQESCSNYIKKTLTNDNKINIKKVGDGIIYISWNMT